MAQKRDRFFALMGALLFLISASALTIAVIYDSVTSKDKATQPTTSQQTSCDIQVPVSAPPETLPASFDPKNADVKKLEIEDLTVGTGAVAKNGDCLYVKYYGTLAKDGSKFDENYSSGTGIQLMLGAGQVIPGWEQGLAGMKVGGVRRMVIPADLAYGSAGQGSIPGNATLVFLVKLVKIK
jgi:FKBP-type peptidyl-prolyl cis-trans isomerase